ncbi:hypothetical protein D9M68_354220 [compost metagenome]
MNGILSRSVAFLFLLAIPNSVLANQETQIISAMKEISAAWEQAISSKQLLVTDCADNTYEAIRFNTGSVGVDLRKTDSIMNPYLGIIRINALIEHNGESGSANGAYMHTLDGNRIACFKKISQALKFSSQSDFSISFLGKTVDFVAYYQVQDGKVIISGGNEAFQLNFLSYLSRNENLKRWGAIAMRNLR